MFLSGIKNLFYINLYFVMKLLKDSRATKQDIETQMTYDNVCI